MKCINCGIDNTFKERVENNGCCKNCSHRFVFEPKTMSGVKFTDVFFAKVISDISVNNTFKFTEKQLFYLLNKRLIKKIPASCTSCLSSILTGIGLILAFVSILLIQKTSGIITISIAIFILFIGTALYTYEKKQEIKTCIVSLEEFQEYLNRWKLVNPIEGILNLPEQQSLSNSINSDIAAYSFDRVVICDSREIANLLIANNFHFENNSAVLSIDRFPENIFDTVMQMLRRNSNLKIYVLHNASPQGVTVVNTLSTNPNWFSNVSNSNITIYDLGLLPRQIFKNPNFFTQISEDSATEAKKLASEIKQDLTKEEIEWLESGKFVELESFTPQKLLRVVTQGISKSRQMDRGGDTSTFIDSNYSGDTVDSCDVMIYSDDCFG